MVCQLFRKEFCCCRGKIWRNVMFSFPWWLSRSIFSILIIAPPSQEWLSKSFFEEPCCDYLPPLLECPHQLQERFPLSAPFLESGPVVSFKNTRLGWHGCKKDWTTLVEAINSGSDEGLNRKNHHLMACFRCALICWIFSNSCVNGAIVPVPRFLFLLSFWLH